MIDVPGFHLTLAPEDQAQKEFLAFELSQAGVEMEIRSGAHFAHPVRLRWEFPNCGKETQLKVQIGKNTKVVVVEELASKVESGKWKVENPWTHNAEVFLEDGAEAEFISINALSADVVLDMKQRSQLGDNAKVSWRNVTLGGRQVDHYLESELRGADSVSEVDWMFYAKDEEKYRLTVRNVFLGRHGGGEITMKGVAEEKGHVRCDGMIKIGLTGGETDTYLTQDVLMLDKTAKVDAIPGLEIKTNDVKASHSATVSRVTEEDLFYFAARGIVEREARRMFVEGFLGDLVAKISNGNVKEELLVAIKEKYGS